MDLAEAIYSRWAELRASQRFEEVLPSARAWRSVTESGEVFGYDTCHHQFYRRVKIPGSGPAGGDGIAGLVESYFSVRHGNGWGHNLHVHVVEVKNQTLQVSDLAHLFRCVAGLRVGLGKTGISEKMQAKHWMHRNLYVHGALLGPSASGDVLMAEAMLDSLYDHGDNGYPQPPIRVGIVSVNSKKDIVLKRMEPGGNYFSQSYRYHRDEPHGKEARLAEVLEGLLGSAPMWSEWVAARCAEESEIQERRQREREEAAPAAADASAQAAESETSDDNGAGSDSGPQGRIRHLN